ncbi:hypothetical protein ACH492_22270 [Streptomyces sp. NPDC019443]|uniref:hypothetical protein n=1 Tax=Streptomyces sp. NPDC019443 TaxID=3365061 RepID=UPI00378B1345
MNAKRLAARCTAAITAVVFVAAVSAGAYYDVGGWPGVAVVWGIGAVVLGLVRAFVWALDNWNTS